MSITKLSKISLNSIKYKTNKINASNYESMNNKIKLPMIFFLDSRCHRCTRNKDVKK